ncbi:MAG: creatininase family protein [Gemmatimonadales bacterium]
MHGGEAETSIILATYPELVRDRLRDADHLADERRYLLTVGIRGYTDTGIIGRPSLATAEKGQALLDSFALQLKDHLGILRSARHRRGEDFLYGSSPRPQPGRGSRRGRIGKRPPRLCQPSGQSEESCRPRSAAGRTTGPPAHTPAGTGS